MVISQNNVVEWLKGGNGIKKQRLYNTKGKRKYKLLEAITFELTNGEIIEIPKGFIWDLSSVPRIFWVFLPPDGNWEIAALIHDYLYRFKIGIKKWADKEMLSWSKVLHTTKSKISLRRLDNKARYWGVRLFGRKSWNK